jgi:hypothetical protein
MNHEVAGESADDLISLAKAQGFRVSKHQIARWHRFGLLPLPQGRRFLGRAAGSQTIYPAGTGAQLLALLEIHAKERRLPYVGWLLWWAGYRSPIRKQVPNVLERVVVLVDKAIESKLELGAFEGRRLTEKAVSRARRRVGRKPFPQFVRLILDAARGRAGQLDPIKADLLERGLGLDRARDDRVKGAEPWLQGDIDGALRYLPEVFHPDELRQNLESADDQDLEGARDEVRSLISVLKSFASITELIFGPHAFGLDIFRDLDTSEPLIQAFLLLVWLDLRTHPAFMEACKTLIAALPRPTEQTIGFEGLVQLGHEVPGLGDILNVRRLRTAIGNPEMVKALNEELKERLQQHRVEVDAFMQRHPIFQQAINVLLGLEAR